MTRQWIAAAGLATLTALHPVPAPAQSTRPDANTTRLFFAPTGRTLARGEGYVGIYEAVLPFVQVGITDGITLGGGTPLFFGLESGHPFWLTPKVAIVRGPRVNVAAGGAVGSTRRVAGATGASGVGDATGRVSMAGAPGARAPPPPTGRACPPISTAASLYDSAVLQGQSVSDHQQCAPETPLGARRAPALQRRPHDKVR